MWGCDAEFDGAFVVGGVSRDVGLGGLIYYGAGVVDGLTFCGEFLDLCFGVWAAGYD